MIRWVYERCQQAVVFDSIWVATDNSQIAEVVRGFGGQVVMTRENHATGTDRLAEAAQILNLQAEDIVINVQGDQPALNPDHPARLAQALLDDPSLKMATLAVPMVEANEALDPNHVKVVFDSQGLALYFSRAPIPWPRDGGPGEYYKHIGLYAYRVAFLNQFVTWPRGRWEAIENLEQLRALERGVGLKVLLADGLSPEVDVPEDIFKVEAVLDSNC
jgi:3-deoxy-manno-octulosonate cytidylyltransferase (CMP-KDO synthetase)